MTAEGTAHTEPIPLPAHGWTPGRGLVLTHTAKGRAIPLQAIHQWLRVNAELFGCTKADLLAQGNAADLLEDLLPLAKSLELPLALRSGCAEPPRNLEGLAQGGLFEVCLAPPHGDIKALAPWIAACRSASLPFRILLMPPYPHAEEAPGLLEDWSEAGLRRIELAAHDPFVKSSGVQPAEEALARIQSFLESAQAKRIDAAVRGVPFCLLPEALWPYVLQEPQRRRSPWGYEAQAHNLALRLFERGPTAVQLAMDTLLSGHASTAAYGLDRLMYPFLVARPRLQSILWLIHRILRRVPLVRRFYIPRPDTDAWNRHLDVERSRKARAMPPVCRSCCLRLICEGASPQVRAAFEDARFETQPGELTVSPLAFAQGLPHILDPIDADRLASAPAVEELAQEGMRRAQDVKPTLLVSSYDYGIEGHWADQCEGGVRWLSITPAEKRSTVLANVALPFTASFTLGGGMAEYGGFQLNRSIRLACPLDNATHRFVLHAGPHGNYVLLRDGVAVHPAVLAAQGHPPARLPQRMDVRIVLGNIDGAIMTSNVAFWLGAAPGEDPPSETGGDPPFFSFILVCTRFARRLQASLATVLHQEEVDPASIEVIVCYVPGADAVEDVIESCEHIAPEVRFVRAAFGEEHVRAKGLMINEAVGMARGEWIVLMDADILLPPQALRRLQALGPDVLFAAPDGRKMLDAHATARILMGETHPWASWDNLVASAAEYRFREAHGVPIGFFQALRRQCFEKIQYVEQNHFEGSDFMFGNDAVKEFGPARRLDGMPVLHMDHGGSQWYGTPRHR